MLAGLSKVGTANRIAKAGLGKGLTVAARAMRKRAPSPRFRKAIGRRNAIPRGRSRHIAKVGLNVNVGKGKWMPHAHLAILGTGQRVRGNKLGATERAQPGNSKKGIRPGPRGKRGIGGKYYFMETLTPGQQFRRRTGRVRPAVSFVRQASESSMGDIQRSIRAGVSAQLQREIAKRRKKLSV